MKLSATTIILLIILGIIVVALLFAWIRPYTIKYDTTLAITGGLGSGKTLTATKIALNLWKRRHLRWRIREWWVKLVNKIRIKANGKRESWNIQHPNRKQKKIKDLLLRDEEPLLYSNIPLLIRKRYKGKKLYATKLTKEMLLLKERIHEGSITLIDELPQLVNQFNWNIKEVQDNVNEFITFYRHYIGSHFIVTAQSIDDIVVQIRRKLNSYYWLYDFHKIFFIFYKVRICNLMTSDLITNISTTFLEDNTKWKYGCLLPRRYQSRCYKHRYDKVVEGNKAKFKKLYTRKVIRFGNYESPLDPKSSKEKGGYHIE